MKLMTGICLRCCQMVVYVFGTPYLLVFWCFRLDFILNIIYLKTGHANSALPPPQYAFQNFSLTFFKRVVVKPTGEQDLNSCESHGIWSLLSLLLIVGILFSLEVKRKYSSINYYSWMALMVVEKEK